MPQSVCECDAQAQAQRLDRVRYVTLPARDGPEGRTTWERQAPDIASGIQTLRHQESVGRDAQRGVMLKPAPTPSLMGSQPKAPLQVLVIPLNARTHFGDQHHLRQGGLLWRGGEEVFCWLGLTFGPLDQQPLLRAHLGGEVVPMSRTHLSRGETPAAVRLIWPHSRDL